MYPGEVHLISDLEGTLGKQHLLDSPCDHECRPGGPMILNIHPALEVILSRGTR